MILLVHLESVTLQRLNEMLLSFPGMLRHKIQLIHCLTNPKKFHKISYKTVYNKPIFFIPNNPLSEEILSADLQKYDVLIHHKYTSIYIINILKQLKDFQIFIEADKESKIKFVDDKNLYIEVIAKLSRISNVTSKSLPVKKSNKKRTYVPISRYYTREELKQAILSNRKRSIIQFDFPFKKSIPKREILKSVTHQFLRRNPKKFEQISTISGNREIELLKGVEYLSRVEQNELVEQIKKNASDILQYRFIVNGKIPDILLRQNYHIRRFAPKLNEKTDIDYSLNKSALFIKVLREICKQKGVTIDWVYRIDDYINNDSFKELLTQFEGLNDLEENITKVIDAKKINSSTIKITDVLLWYELIHNHKKPRRKKQKLEKQRRVKSVKRKKKPPKRKKILADHSQALRERILELNQKYSGKKVIIREEKNEEVMIPQPRRASNKKILEFRHVGAKWEIIWDGDLIGDNFEYSSKGIHLIKELVENHSGAANFIYGDKLNRILLNKLPSVKKFIDKKAATEVKRQRRKKTKSKLLQAEKTPGEATLNALRENIKTVANIKKGPLKFLWYEDKKFFIFSKDGCYYRPNKGIKIIFYDQNLS